MTDTNIDLDTARHLAKLASDPSLYDTAATYLTGTDLELVRTDEGVMLTAPIDADHPIHEDSQLLNDDVQVLTAVVGVDLSKLDPADVERELQAIERKSPEVAKTLRGKIQQSLFGKVTF